MTTDTASTSADVPLQRLARRVGDRLLTVETVNGRAPIDADLDPVAWSAQADAAMRRGGAR